MLRWRLTIGTLIIAAIVGLCWLDYHATWPGIYLLPVALVVSLLGAGELLAMFRKRGNEPLAWAVFAGTALTVLAAAAPGYLPSEWMNATIGRLGWLALGLAAGLLLTIVGELIRYESPGRATTGLAVSSFAIMYAGGLMGFLVQLRLLSGGRFDSDGHWGMFALASFIATVKMSDTGQYTFGRMFGRHKLAPKVSPGKTWEGAIGGVLVAILTALLIFHWASPTKATAAQTPGTVRADILSVAIFALAVATAGIVGDLAESLLKRDADVKDSSSWMPGFGGVLDLLDSLLGAAPVAYAFWVLGFVGPGG